MEKQRSTDAAPPTDARTKKATMAAHTPSKHHHTDRAGWRPLVSRMMRPRIVVAGDDVRLLRFMHHKLGRAGYHVCRPPAARPLSTSSTAMTRGCACWTRRSRCETAGRSCAEVRDAGRHDLKVIVMTARCVEAEIAQVRRFGAVACLAKPFSLGSSSTTCATIVGPERPATR
jgi:DNA-binding NtrC family response regulator